MSAPFLKFFRRPSIRLLWAAGLTVSFFCSACTSLDRPTSELIIASAALKAAERAQAERKSPDLFTRAQNAMWKANRLYLAKEFEDSKKAAFEARRLAERAELDAEVKASQSTANPTEGGTPP